MNLSWELMSPDPSPPTPNTPTPIDDGTRPPPSRTYFSMVGYQGKLWMFGGFGDARGRFNDIRTYDIATKKWSLLENKGDFPKPIYLHTAVIYKTKMYVFGGSTGKDTNDFYAFDFESRVWSRLPVSASAPSPRYGHAACVCGDVMYIVGGCKANSIYFNDAYSYDFRTGAWSKLGDVPITLAYHSLTPYENRIYLFGGYNGQKFGQHIYGLDSSTGQWNIVPVTGKAPPPSCGCAVVAADQLLWVFGGYTASGHTNELYRLHFPSKKWEHITITSKPVSRAYLQSALVDGALYIFGGYDGSKCVTDFRRLQISLNMAKMLIEESIPSQVNTALRHFSKKQADSLDRKELEALFTNISRHLSTIQTSVSVANAYPFDTSRVQDAVDCGFTRQHVIDCLQIMHDQGQDTSNFNLLLDRCLHYQDNPKPNGAPNSLSLSRQNSGKDDVKHQEQLKQQLKSAVEEKEELRTCKICYENIMDCVLLQCGHLTACQSCAVSMQKSDLPCPCCRRKITGNFKVYWS